MVLRIMEHGKPVYEGAQVQIGGHRGVMSLFVSTGLIPSRKET